ncbi:RISC-loading complex subunit tarbp2-like [Colletes latitarsis]|uniref:RISC-loading complex subunit tarbp2-like n=1 Tax=Colletes latitarsis TaxID=2605962 RepID=UPI0040374F7B
MYKTPVMILQESTMKLGSLPSYTEMSPTTNNNQIIFNIQVKWKNYSCVGTGSNKKSAKQNAAKTLLTMLVSSKEISESVSSFLSQYESSNSIINMSDSTSDMDSSFNSSSNSCSSVKTTDLEDILDNYVSRLQEFCISNSIPTPCYDTISVNGPPHLSVFTVSCDTNNVHKEASAHKKKVAKQKVAKEVLEYLMANANHHTDKSNINIVNLENDDLKFKKVINIYRGLNDGRIIPTDNTVQIKDYHDALSNLFSKVPKEQKNYLVNRYMLDKYKNDLNDVRSIICDTLKLTVNKITFQTKQKNIFMVGIRLTSMPIIFQIGKGTTIMEAEKQALCKLFEQIFLFFS